MLTRITDSKSIGSESAGTADLRFDLIFIISIEYPSEPEISALSNCWLSRWILPNTQFYGTELGF